MPLVKMLENIEEIKAFHRRQAKLEEEANKPKKELTEQDEIYPGVKFKKPRKRTLGERTRGVNLEELD